jgi:Zn-dependent protease with chaperone function
MTTTTPTEFGYRVNPKEEFYFAVKIFFSIILYFLIYKAVVSLMDNPVLKGMDFVFLFYGGIILFYLIFRMIFLVGYLRGNAVRVSPRQFPDIYNIVVKQAQMLNMSTVPNVYIMQSGGVLNAFATAFMGTNYVVIFSDVLAAAYEQNEKVVEFIIGHEMGHVKRKHILKRLLLLPGSFIPFLGPAYSRACEYTCDSIGHALCPEGARPGMLLLAAGRGLYGKVNVKAYLDQIETEDGFTRWFAEKLASHPNLTKRIRAFDDLGPAPVAAPVVVQAPPPTEDPTKYMPNKPLTLLP